MNNAFNMLAVKKQVTFCLTAKCLSKMIQTVKHLPGAIKISAPYA